MSTFTFPSWADLVEEDMGLDFYTSTPRSISSSLVPSPSHTLSSIHSPIPAHFPAPAHSPDSSPSSDDENADLQAVILASLVATDLSPQQQDDLSLLGPVSAPKSDTDLYGASSAPQSDSD